jgi:hypothetical protein
MFVSQAPSALWHTKLTTAKVHPFVPRILEVSPRKTAISRHHARKAKMIWNEWILSFRFGRIWGSISKSAMAAAAN